MEKKCSRCKNTKPIEDFKVNTDSRQNNYCLLCDREQALIKKFNINLIEYEALFNKQKGKCGICLESDVESINMAVDHDHVTGAIRGLLCRPCNIGIGLLKDDIERLGMAIRYLQNGGTNVN